MTEKRTRPEPVPLAHLALACLMFDSMTGYNKSLDELHVDTDGRIDLALESHRLAMVTWLNKWGCRHLSKEQHGVASNSILAWYEVNAPLLQCVASPLWRLSAEDTWTVAKTYEALRDLPGAPRERKGKQLTASIGPTAASKVLFALKPASVPPWDEAMRKHFSCDGSAESYQKFLETVGGMALNVSAQCERNGFPISRLPIELGRPNATVVSLLNEYLWVTISAGARLPHRFTLGRWAEW